MYYITSSNLQIIYNTFPFFHIHLRDKIFLFFTQYNFFFVSFYPHRHLSLLCTKTIIPIILLSTQIRTFDHIKVNQLLFSSISKKHFFSQRTTYFTCRSYKLFFLSLNILMLLRLTARVLIIHFT